MIALHHFNANICAKFRLYLCVIALAAITHANEVVILYTADVHGCVFNSGLCGEARDSGGLLRCAALIEDVRKRNPDVVLLDLGDLFQGTAESYLTRGLLVAEIVKSMRYDGLVVGNHEFDWGIETLWKFYERAETQVLAADIFTAPPAHSERAGSQPPIHGRSLRPQGIRPYFIKQINGVRLAVIGLSNPHMPHWFKPEVLKDLFFSDSSAAIRSVLPEVRAARPDVIVLAVHQGFRDWGDNPANNINKIAAGFPELTAIIGAHTHNSIPMEEINGILYTQAGPYARSLGKLTIDFDLKTRRIVNRKAELLSADASVMPSSEMLSRYSRHREDTGRYLNQVIGTAACEHPGTPVTPGQSRVQSLITTAIAERTGAEVVLHGCLTDATLFAGPVCMRDIWRVVPYENSIGVADLTREEIVVILKENSRYYNSSQFRGVYGMTYCITFDGNGDSCISDIRIGGQPAEPPPRRYKIAFNSFDLASAGNRLPRLREITEKPSSMLRNTGLETRQIVIDYVANHPDFDILNVPPAAGAMDLSKRPSRRKQD
ncbi:MAG: bifunctional metallophosphatase/5'-nucleotidase [Kiritimatiellia bacterium]